MTSTDRGTGGPELSTTFCSCRYAAVENLGTDFRESVPIEFEAVGWPSVPTPQVAFAILTHEDTMAKKAKKAKVAKKAKKKTAKKK